MRKTAEITIDAVGRDTGKIFVLREMPASQAEKWAMRALLALAKSGVELPDGVAAGGFAAVAAIGVRALGALSFAEAEPLLDEMMGCVQRRPDPAKPMVRALVEDDIEEIETRIKLRLEIFNLHTESFRAAVAST